MTTENRGEVVQELQKSVTTLEANEKHMDRRVTTLEANEKNTDRRIVALETMPTNIAEIKTLLATLTTRLDGHHSSAKVWQGFGQSLLTIIVSIIVGAVFKLVLK
ncbi:MAG: hypothetical protein HC933_08510 [Pleurocapsa sp. SU_196_0]|nr:hypothetical protein [Pleurocapsa sp. SU_196_0]